LRSKSSKETKRSYVSKWKNGTNSLSTMIAIRSIFNSPEGGKMSSEKDCKNKLRKNRRKDGKKNSKRPNTKRPRLLS
jgi:hypothetical protein